EYGTDLGYPPPATGDLTPWSDRGVVLLNRVLTVRPGNPASHRGKGWEAVTECAIRALAGRPPPPGPVLWGRDAGGPQSRGWPTATPTSQRSTQCTRRRCRRSGDSSALGRSAGRMRCWRRWAQ